MSEEENQNQDYEQNNNEGNPDEVAPADNIPEQENQNPQGDNEENNYQQQEIDVPKKNQFTAEEFLGKEINYEQSKGDFSTFLLKDNDMYVCNPTKMAGKIKVKTHTEYTLMGDKVEGEIKRRFKDFYTLRLKLVERWPGIYIPRTPHRKIIGSKNEEVVEERIEMINEFCSKISKIKYLFEGEEIRHFLSQDENAIKQLEDLPKENYEDLNLKYCNSFPEFDENYDFEEGKNEVKTLYEKLKESLPTINQFMEGIQKAKEIYISKKIDTFNAFKNMKKFEEGFLGKNARNEDLVFNNLSNTKVSDTLKAYEDFVKNTNTHYDNFYNKVLSHYLTIEALIECFDGFLSLENDKQKLETKLRETEESIAKNQNGQKSLKSTITLKNLEQDSAMLSEKKDQLEKNINDLSNIIKISLFTIKRQYEAFKVISIDRFYKMYKLLICDTKKYAAESDNLFNTVINHPNLKNININK